MKQAGPIIGLPFSWEGTAFFLEAIALGLFLYGWERLPERAHFVAGVLVGVCGVASGILVVSANGWMNSPAGFRWVNGQALDVDPVAAMFNAAWASQALHMTLAAFVSTSFAVAGVHALRLLRQPGARLHQLGLRIALVIGGISAVLQPISGDHSAKDVARRQPAKLAAMEGLYRTQRGAPLLIGGVPDDATQSVSFGLEIPHGLSFLAFADPDAQVTGLDRIPRDEWPPTLVCHAAFQVMVGCGSVLLAVGMLSFYLLRRRPAALGTRWFLALIALCTPLGFLAVEAGWVVTEVGRQPWIIYGVLRTSEALTPMPGLRFTLLASVLIYLLLTAVVFGVLRDVIRKAEAGPDPDAPHAPARTVLETEPNHG
jgi:cytochrome d ubiquinol oxidase subunit I